jgi:hypothetical protein
MNSSSSARARGRDESPTAQHTFPLRPSKRAALEGSALSDFSHKIFCIPIMRQPKALYQPGEADMPIPTVPTGPRRGEERKRNQDGTWRKKRDDSGKPRK